METLSPDNYDLAAEILSLPDKIRGFGPVKLESVESTARLEADLIGRHKIARQAAA